MSRLSNLLRQVETQDPQLAADLKREVEALSGRRAFGLNFERHIPETVELPNRTVRRGDKVRFLPERGEKPSSVDRRLWRVDRIRRTRLGTRGRLGPPAGSRRLELRDRVSRAVDDLVVVAEFRDPIYPGLVSTGKVERGGDRPFHTVINAENFHALQVLLYTHEGRVDAIYIDPPYNTGARDWRYNNDYVDGDDCLPALQVARDDGSTTEAGKATAQPGRLRVDRRDRRAGSPPSLACSSNSSFSQGQDIQMVTSPHQSAKGVVHHRGSSHGSKSISSWSTVGAATPATNSSATCSTPIKNDRGLNKRQLSRSPCNGLRRNSSRQADVRRASFHQFYPIFVENQSQHDLRIPLATRVEDDVERLLWLIRLDVHTRRLAGQAGRDGNACGQLSSPSVV